MPLTWQVPMGAVVSSSATPRALGLSNLYTRDSRRLGGAGTCSVNNLGVGRIGGG